MFRTIATIAVTVIVVIFGMQNFDHVPIYFFLGKPVHIRLFFVIAIAGVTGYVIRSLTGIGREERLKRKLQALMQREYNRKRRIPEPDEE